MEGIPPYTLKGVYTKRLMLNKIIETIARWLMTCVHGMECSTSSDMRECSMIAFKAYSYMNDFEHNIRMFRYMKYLK